MSSERIALRFLPLLFAISGCADEGWSLAGAMAEARAFHTATTLQNGDILFAGGESGGTALKTAEIYDPKTETWRKAGAMLGARRGQTSTLLDDGRVLVAGGEDGGALSSAEIYDPATDTWSSAGSMMEARARHTANLLRNGLVLVVGGEDGETTLHGGEVYNQQENAWSVIASPMMEARTGHTATLLRDGRVLVVGGRSGGGTHPSAEVYDPHADAESAWAGAGAMKAPRWNHTATRLHSGDVLVAGGDDGEDALKSAELYAPETNTWSGLTSLAEAREGHTATLLRNKEVLLVGGGNGESNAASAEVFTLEGTFSEAGSLAGARRGHTATLIADGDVLVAGGEQGGALKSVEVYRPGAQCETTDDCPASLVCNEQKECAPLEGGALGNSCALSRGEASGRHGVIMGMASLFALIRRGRRRRRGALRVAATSMPLALAALAATAACSPDPLSDQSDARNVALPLGAEGVAIHWDDREAKYPVEIDPLSWAQQGDKLAPLSEYFGIAVAIDGDTALIGANRETIGGSIYQGSAYVFTRAGVTWMYEDELVAADGAPGDEFGWSVALSGDTALVGTRLHNAARGAAYVFTRSGGAWTQQAKLTAMDGAADDSHASDFFGVSVALSGDTALVGAFGGDKPMGADEGSAYVFTRTGAAWTPEAKLFASDGAAGDAFGFSVALSGDTALVGAIAHDLQEVDEGSAYVFTRAGATWTPEAKLTAMIPPMQDDHAGNDQFGYSVALSGDTALVGAPQHDLPMGADQGAAYVFTRTGGVWAPQQRLSADLGSAKFGSSVALSGDTALVGAFAQPIGQNNFQGAAYVFTRSGSMWMQQAMLSEKDGAANDVFGNSVALSGNTALIGAVLDDDPANVDNGAAYVFALSQGSPCLAAADCYSGHCVDGVCCGSACGGGDASDCQACSAAAGAPVDGTCAPLASGAVCRAAAGVCDAAEVCDGSTDLCPVDVKVPVGTECHASAGDCDAAEACDGVADDCPLDSPAPDNTACDDADPCTQNDVCTGGVCQGSGCEPITPGICGDSERTLPEECDDGNTADGDGCSAECRLEDIALSPCDVASDCPTEAALGRAGCACSMRPTPAGGPALLGGIGALLAAFGRLRRPGKRRAIAMKDAR
ncbi:MAG TPA: kelch repeat-containing protein [Polyangiaceae bacterium]|nr:kelch repeat-containing protein [Polyangiaceae bacterium]